MKKFFVKAPVEWINAYIKDGHLEGYIEARNKEEAIEMLANRDFALDFVVDDYSVEDVGPVILEHTYIKEIYNNNNNNKKKY